MKRNQVESAIWRVAVLLMMILGTAACGRDRRPLDVRLQAAVDEGLRKNGVKGASAALQRPYGLRGAPH